MRPKAAINKSRIKVWTSLTDLVVSSGGESKAVVIIEVVVVIHVGLDGVQVYVDVIKLPHQEEARRHALTAWNGVAFVSRGAHQLKALLSDLCTPLHKHPLNIYIYIYIHKKRSWC
jgi:hypothetical protein